MVCYSLFETPKQRIGLAVSGGVDSCYLMHLYAEKCDDNVEYWVLSVDHGLRPESKQEVEWVAEQAQKLGHKAIICTNNVLRPKSAIQNFARNIRYQLLADTAKKYNIKTIYLGHHSNDRAETILSRLNHKTGLAGLCGMPDIFYYDDICFKRPLLELSRWDIEQSMQNKIFMNDPSNHNLKFERVRNRQIINNNLDLQYSLINLSNKAQSLYYPLFYQRNVFLQDFVVFSKYGYCVIDKAAYDAQNQIMKQEILKFVIKFVTGNHHIKSFPSNLQTSFTIANAEICIHKHKIKIFRENRNIIQDDPKRFIINNKAFLADDTLKDIPFKAKRTLPNNDFVYSPHSLRYFVNIFDYTMMKSIDLMN